MAFDETTRPHPGRSLILGCGYLGTRLARILVNAGQQVTGTTRRWESQGAVEAAGAQPKQWDASEPDAAQRLEELAQDMDWVFCSVAPSRGMSYRDVYQRTAEHMASVLPALSPRAVVYVSSSSVYGSGDEKWTDEDTPPRPIGANAKVLAQAERILLRAGGKGLPIRVVRSAGIYGPARVPAYRLRDKDVFVGTGQEWLNLIHVDDLARILAAVAQRGRDGAVYLAADGNPVRRSEYYREAARLSSLPQPRFSGRRRSAAEQGSGKRLRSRRLEGELRVTLLYPDFRAGLAAVMGTQAIGAEKTHAPDKAEEETGKDTGSAGGG